MSAAAISNAIGRTESGNRDYTASGAPMTSPKGAMFRMQVMPETAHDPGFGITPARNNSPAEFNRVGEAYWRAMLKEYGSVPKMLGAYNAGPGRMNSLLDRYGDDWLRYAPEETRNYVTNNLCLLGLQGGY